jgi:hypothetical protein
MEEINVYKRWEALGFLSGFKDDGIKKKNAAELYEKMAKYLLSKEGHIANHFKYAAFAIIYRVVSLDGVWNGPFIPSEIEETYKSFYNSSNTDLDEIANVCAKTAEHYAMNKKVSKNKQKNGRVPCIC